VPDVTQGSEDHFYLIHKKAGDFKIAFAFADKTIFLACLTCNPISPAFQSRGICSSSKADLKRAVKGQIGWAISN